MLYLSNFNYIYQIKLKIKLGFKLNNVEGIVFTFYCISISINFVDYVKQHRIELMKRYKLKCF